MGSNVIESIFQSGRFLQVNGCLLACSSVVEADLQKSSRGWQPWLCCSCSGEEALNKQCNPQKSNPCNVWLRKRTEIKENLRKQWNYS